jgi:hypothetical protein
MNIQLNTKYFPVTPAEHRMSNACLALYVIALLVDSMAVLGLSDFMTGGVFTGDSIIVTDLISSVSEIIALFSLIVIVELLRRGMRRVGEHFSWMMIILMVLLACSAVFVKLPSLILEDNSYYMEGGRYSLINQIGNWSGCLTFLVGFASLVMLFVRYHGRIKLFAGLSLLDVMLMVPLVMIFFVMGTIDDRGILLSDTLFAVFGVVIMVMLVVPVWALWRMLGADERGFWRNVTEDFV